MLGYKTLKKRHDGFTIVELVIVSIVIAILAAISIVAYNGIQSRAAEAALRSDLDSGSQLTELSELLDGMDNYPNDLSTINDGKPFTPSGDNQYVYRAGYNYDTGATGYCLILYNVKYNLVAWIDINGVRHSIKNPAVDTELCNIQEGTTHDATYYGVTSTNPLTIGEIGGHGD